MNTDSPDDLLAGPEERTFASAPWLLMGAALGTGIMLLLRVQYYEWMGYQPNMAPQVAYLFSPLIFGVVCLVVLPSEWLMRKWRKQRLVKPMSAVLIGAAYATLLVVWAFPSHASVALLINPVTLRVLLWWRYQADAQAD